LTVATLTSENPRPPEHVHGGDDGLVSRARVGAQRDAHVAVGARFLEQRGAQRLGTGVDELAPVHQITALLGHAHDQRLAADLLGRHGARVRQVHVQSPLVAEPARQNEEHHQQQHHVDQRHDVDLRLLVAGAS